MKKNKLHIFILSCYLLFSGCHFALAQDKWPGVDESVVEKVAAEHGRKAWTPFINTDQGDLLLFAFLLAGAIGGFALGFFWQKLFCEDKEGR